MPRHAGSFRSCQTLVALNTFMPRLAVMSAARCSRFVSRHRGSSEARAFGRRCWPSRHSVVAAHTGALAGIQGRRAGRQFFNCWVRPEHSSAGPCNHRASNPSFQRIAFGAR